MTGPDRCGGPASRARPALTAWLAGATLAVTACAPGPDPVSMVSDARPTTTAAFDEAEWTRLARSAVVRVRNTGCGGLSTGSAWLAGDSTFVSNRHVVEDHEDLDLQTWDGRDLDPTGVEVNDGVDLGRMVGDWSAAPYLQPLPLRTDRVQPGERIAVLGYPEGDELTVRTGTAVGYVSDPMLSEREVLKLTTIVRPGNSGGPAVDEQGRVVGVVYAELIASDEALVVPVGDLAAVTFRPEAGCS